MITILTPTFNRAHTLHRLFESLRAQTNSDFEWLVVDDGSTDETRALIAGLKDADITIRYVYQRNAGKHVAVNTGVQHALGSWVFIVDSDDGLTPDAIESLSVEIERKEISNATGICYRKAYFDFSMVGESRTDDEPRFMHPSIAGRYFKGDLAYIFRIETLRSHPFPVFSGEKFVPELYVWNLIGDECPVWYIPQKAIYLCEYLPDGYTANFKEHLKRNPKGFGLFYRAQIGRERSLLAKVKCAVRAIQCLFYKVLTRREQ